MASISRKLLNEVSITILPMFCAGRQSHKNGAVFLLGLSGFYHFYGFGSWEVEMLWVCFMGVTLVHPKSDTFKFIFWLNASFLSSDDDRDILKELGSQDLCNAGTKLPSYLDFFLFHLYVYRL
jgi:hypothetical protein